MARQAKCDRCRIRYVWDPALLPEGADEYTKRLVKGRPSQIWKQVRLGMAACHECGHPLSSIGRLSRQEAEYTVKGNLPLNIFDREACRLRGAQILEDLKKETV